MDFYQNTDRGTIQPQQDHRERKAANEIDPLMPPVAKDEVRGAVTFRKSKEIYLFLAVLVVGAATSTPVLLMISGPRHGWPSLDELILYLAPVVWLALGAKSFQNLSEIVLCEESISRRLFGCYWQRIPWTNVRVVRVIAPFRIYGDVGSGTGSFLRICPRSQEPPTRCSRRGIAFNDLDIINSAELTALLNHYIARHKIPVELVCRGVKQAVDRLPSD